MNREEGGSGWPGLGNPDPLVGVLVGYLLAASGTRHPDADGLTVEDVLAAEYPPASAAGRVPGPDELVRRHPELADAVVAFFRRCG
jgi:hypothetical protein